MQLDIQARGFVLTPALAAAVRREAAELADRAGGRSLWLQVRLFDVNSTRGGVDKGCLLTARVGGGRRTAAASSLNADLYRAIPAAFEKLARAVLTATHRERALRRRSDELRDERFN